MNEPIVLFEKTARVLNYMVMAGGTAALPIVAKLLSGATLGGAVSQSTLNSAELAYTLLTDASFRTDFMRHAGVD